MSDEITARLLEKLLGAADGEASEPERDSDAPVLLTKAEVLEFAAGKLRHMAQVHRIGKMVLSLAERAGTPPEELRRARSAFVEPDLQIRVLTEVAKDLSALAVEEKILAARSASKV